MVDFLKRLFGGGRKTDAATRAEPASPPEPRRSPIPPSSEPPASETDPELEAAFQATCESRQRFWSGVGALEPDVIRYLMSPGLMGGPYWPTLRQAFQVIRRPGAVIVSTDGLADPFDDTVPCGNGFEIELFVETPSLPPEMIGGHGVEAFQSNWTFALVENVARVVADAGGIRQDLDELGVISAELPGMINHPAIAQQLPARFITAHGSVGVLIGVPAASVPALIEDTPNATVRVASIVLLTAAELDHVTTAGAEGRQQILAHLLATTGHLCDLERPSAV